MEEMACLELQNKLSHCKSVDKLKPELYYYYLLLKKCIRREKKEYK